MAETGDAGPFELTSHRAWGWESGEGPGGTIGAVLRRGSAVKAVVIDQWPMLRLGLARVLQTVDVNISPYNGAGAGAVPPRVAISKDGSRAYASGQTAIAVLRLR